MRGVLSSEKTFDARRNTIPVVGEHQKRLMLKLWREGVDTDAIAHRLELLEWQVANELPRLREATRV